MEVLKIHRRKKGLKLNRHRDFKKAAEILADEIKLFNALIFDAKKFSN